MLWRELGRKRNQGREENEILGGVEGRPLGEVTRGLTPVEDAGREDALGRKGF